MHNRQTWAASEMRRMTKSLWLMTSKTSPKVPFSSVNPHALASPADGESGRRPMTTCRKRKIFFSPTHVPQVVRNRQLKGNS